MLRSSFPIVAAGLVFAASCSRVDSGPASPAPAPPSGKTETAILAGGCFWCIESAFLDLPGVVEAVSGYTGGHVPNPTYEQVGSGTTGHYEAVQVRFDPATIDYARILDVFWRHIDPTDAGGQFADRGPSYRTAIFVLDEGQRRIADASKRALADSGWFDAPIATEILPAAPFYEAEEYHQKYCKKNPTAYRAYARGSGREAYIERTWKEKPLLGSQAWSPASFKKPTDAELRSRLTKLQFEVTQHGATEPPFDNAYWDHHGAGIYVDVVSGEPLFSSADKFDSGTGWPSFTRPLERAHVVEAKGADLLSGGAQLSSRYAGSHLGHVFADGPAPTGLRYCIDSASLRFIPAERLRAEGYGAYAERFEIRDKSAPISP